MASNSKKRIMIQKKAVDRKHHSPKKYQSNARRSVTKQAPTSEEECPMRFCVYLNGSNHLIKTIVMLKFQLVIHATDELHSVVMFELKLPETIRPHPT
jgi:hypothetical protein